MKITKLGHACLLIEENETRILIDPGIFAPQASELKNIDAVLITHEHSDHLSLDLLKQILENNPQAKIYTNTSVGALLTEANITFNLLTGRQAFQVNEIPIKSFEVDHAPLHSSIPQIKNTGYFIAERLFYPGDSLINPEEPIEILALPVAGPWLRLSEAIDYTLALKPEQCFPVHEGILKTPGLTHLLPPKVLEPAGINFVILEIDKENEF